MTKAAKVLKSLDELGKKQFLPSIGPIKGKIVEDVIKKYQPKNILEIGSLYGYSAILMANILPDEGKVLAIEIDKKNAQIAQKNIEDAGFVNKIDLLTGNALDLIPKIDHKIDLLFLDAEKNEYIKYLNLAESKNLIKKDTIIIADNVGIFKDQMLDYLEYVRNSGMYRSETIETTVEFSSDKDAIEVSVRIV